MAELSAEARETMNSFPSFTDRVPEEFSYTLDKLDTLQVNVGYLCNLACKHCHVSGGPNRTEIMERATFEDILELFFTRGFTSLDITGGAPEMNPNFEWFIREVARRAAAGEGPGENLHLIVRSNLCILKEPEYQHLPELYAELGVNIFASLPHYNKRNMEKQRGAGSFDPVIEMLVRLNELGYGKGDPKHELDLVFNPAGAVLPPDQSNLEAEYKQKLAADFGITFDNLFAITNCPGGRFGNALQSKGMLGKYMQKLVDAFNPDTVEAMMCRSQISVDWEGKLHDCDFNLCIGISTNGPTTVKELLADTSGSLKRKLVLGNHCYCCTAGAGSS